MKAKHLLLLGLSIVIGLPILGLFTYGSQNYNPMMTNQWIEGGTPMGTPMMRQDAVSESKEIFEANLAAPMPIEPDYAGFTPDLERTIIKTATLSLLANNTQELVDRISAKTKEFNGLVTSSNIYELSYNGALNAEITVRVPVEKLEEVLAAFKQLAVKVTGEQINATDETERKVDLQAQLNNLQATEIQLLNIMKQAKDVNETLQVQRELTNVRDRIERLQAQLDNLTGAAEMSTINISISTKESELPVIDPGQKTLLEELKLAFKDMVRLYRQLSIAGLRIGILALPLILIGGGAYWLIKRRK